MLGLLGISPESDRGSRRHLCIGNAGRPGRTPRCAGAVLAEPWNRPPRGRQSATAAYVRLTRYMPLSVARSRSRANRRCARGGVGPGGTGPVRSRSGVLPCYGRPTCGTSSRRSSASSGLEFGRYHGGMTITLPDDYSALAPSVRTDTTVAQSVARGSATAWSDGRGRGPRPSLGRTAFGARQTPATFEMPFLAHWRAQWLPWCSDRRRGASWPRQLVEHRWKPPSQGISLKLGHEDVDVLLGYVKVLPFRLTRAVA
jgi:hypothetical protein